MKIGLVHRYYPVIGGVSTVVRNLKIGLEKGGNRVEVLTGFENENNEDNITTIDDNNLFFYKNVLGHIKEREFDVIHSHSFPTSLFHFFSDIPAILSVHSTPLEEYETHSDKDIPLAFRMFKRTVAMKLAFKRYDRIIAVSNLIKNVLVSRYNVDEDKIDVIYNSVDTDIFRPVKVKKDDTLKVLLVGSGDRKGVELVPQWAEEITNEIDNVEFIIKGGKFDVPENLKKNFRFVGSLPYEEIPNLYNEADILIMPSLYEAFGIVALEAMACGKCVIVSEGSGVSEVIDNNENGIISPIDEFPDNITRLLKEKETRKRIGKNARKLVEKEFSIEAIAQKHMEVYKKVSRK